MKRRSCILLRGHHAGLPALAFVALALLHLPPLAVFASDGQSLESRFLSPPDMARPWVYWFWMDGNVTKEGITADLEAMHRVGIGGALMMGVGLSTPPGNADFNSPLWRELYAHAAGECVRLGMKLTLHQCDGWATGGGPWITPDRSIKMLVWTTKEVAGPGGRPIQLAQPFTKEEFYEDVATLAVPLPADSKPLEPSSVTVNGKDDRSLFDGNLQTGAAKVREVVASFDEPRRLATAVFKLADRWPYALGEAADTPAVVEVSSDGRAFRQVTRFDLNVSIDNGDHFTLTASFPVETAKAVRIRIEKPRPFRIQEIELLAERRVHLWEVKSSLAREREHGGETPWIDAAPWPEAAAGIDPAKVIDLSDKLSADGILDWQVPEGRWRIIRTGMTSTAKHVAPRTHAGEGLEADKMSGEAIRFHWDSFAKGMIDENNVAAGNPIFSVHTDSWESAIHTWSSRFAEQFKKRRGYDIRPWLPVLAGGTVVGTPEESERLLWDVRRTMADLIADNFYGVLREKCHESGVLFQSEAAGRQMFMYDPLNYAAKTDIYVGEFWMPSELRVDCRVAASAAHTYGRPLAAAESFTSGRGNFRDDPFSLKTLGDHAFCTGINRYIVHRYCMQPFNGVEPGLTFGPYGINFERTQTWWENGAKAWCDYVARCQSLLQTGTFVADVIYYIGQDAPNYLGHRHEIWNPIPAGYDYDGCNLEILRRLEVSGDGRLMLPSGMRYRVLLLPNREHMTLEAAREIERLVRAGATAVGPKPVRTPGLKEWKANDTELKKITARVWGDIDGTSVTAHRFGKGTMIFGPSLEAVLAKIAPPDFDYREKEGATLRYIHRRTDDAEFYFVANANPDAAVDCTASFRVSGKGPELWDAATGTMFKPAVYRHTAETTELPIHFDPGGSWFVVFREPTSPHSLASIRRDGQKLFPAEESAATPEARQIQTERASPPAVVHEAEQGGSAVAVPRVVFSDGLVNVLDGSPGNYTAVTAAGQSVELVINESSSIALSGSWTLSFPAGKQAPPRIELPKLTSWTESEDDGVKYFSGTATYTTTFDWDKAVAERSRVVLDLGEVKHVAEITLNGRSLGTLWKPPFKMDVSRALKTGTNELEVRVTNLWPNRLIGDEKLHPDSSLDYRPSNLFWSAGGPLKSIPEWAPSGGASPVGRTTFVLWRFYDGDEPLLESGLLGPVTLTTADPVAGE